MKSIKNLSEGPISPAIFKMTLSMMIGMVSIVAFNLIDTYFVGKLGKTALAAMSFTLPVVMLQGSISMGLGVGASSVIARAIGKKDHDAVKRLTTDALILSLLFVIFFVLIGLFTIEPLFRALGAKEELIPFIRDYMSIWYLGVPFVVVPMVGNNAIRATGNTLIPSLIMFLSVVINTILDPLLIFGIGIFPEMGLKGAALATLISRALSLISSLLFLRYKFNMVTSKIFPLATLKESWKKITYIAFPAAMVQTLTPLSMAFVTKIVSPYGEDAIAALGVSNRIEMFVLFPLMALSSVMIPFIGQNLGAGKIDRILNGFKYSKKFSLLTGFIAFLLFTFLNEPLAHLFIQSKNVVEVIKFYLLVVSISYGLQGITMIGASTFSALHKPFHAAGLNLLRLIVFLIPFSLLGAKLGGLNGIILAISLTSIATGLVSMFWVKNFIKSEFQA